MKLGQKSTRALRLSVSYVILIVLSICSLYPIVWVALSSLRPGASLFSPHLIPSKITFDHYKELFTSPSFRYGLWYWNTFKIAMGSMVLSTLLITLSMYALSRFRFRGRKTLLSMLLVLGMFPGFMSMIAIYIFLLQLNLLDTHTALVLVYASGSVLLGGFVVKGFYDTIPRSLDEAARIDGAGHITIFTRIMLPLSRPMLTYVALTTFTGAWVDFIFAKLILRSKEKWTVAVGLWDLVFNYQNSNFTLFAAGAMMIAVPITLLFVLLQKFLVEGLTAGASKG